MRDLGFGIRGFGMRFHQAPFGVQGLGFISLSLSLSLSLSHSLSFSAAISVCLF